MFKILDFLPYPGLASPHLQLFFTNFSLAGKAPHSKSLIVPLSDGDCLSCEVSTPPNWQPHFATIAMVHGLGGSHDSKYMIRLSRKFYHHGIRVVRINLRGCGSGKGLNQRPYNNGNSHDVYEVLLALKAQTPLSPINLIGFSLGGSIILKMAGELGEMAHTLVNHLFAVCPVLDIAQSVDSIAEKKNWFYQKYFLAKLADQGHRWIKEKKISSLREIDEKITAPLWGYLSADDYYKKCSSYQFIDNIRVPCDLLLAADDPFIDYTIMQRIKKVPSSTSVWLTSTGSHLGFIGYGENQKAYFWMDKWLLKQNLQA